MLNKQKNEIRKGSHGSEDLERDHKYHKTELKTHTNVFNPYFLRGIRLKKYKCILY